MEAVPIMYPLMTGENKSKDILIPRGSAQLPEEIPAFIFGLKCWKVNKFKGEFEMISATEIKKTLAELHCSPNRFAEILQCRQVRLSEILTDKREPAYYEGALIEQTLRRMVALANDVRADYGDVSVCWTPSIRAVLESRHAKHDHSYSVGFRHELPEPDVLRGAEAELLPVIDEVMREQGITEEQLHQAVSAASQSIKV